MLKPSGHTAVHPDIAFGNELTIQTITADEIIVNLCKEGQGKLVDNIDTLYIDVQGAELDVLKGAQEYLRKAKFIFAEVSHGGLYEGGTSLRPLIEFLEEHRFKLAFAYLNKHGWGDALFIRDVYFGQK